jgi:putative transposase
VELYRKKYRVKSTRLPCWDYGSDGYYFITICTKDHEHFFGSCNDGCRDAKSCVSTTAQMELSEIGRLAQKYWYQIPDHFPFVKLDEFVVMPNHVHGIIIIDKDNQVQNANGPVETQDFASLQGIRCNRFGPQSRNLASIVRGYKVGVTKYARKINPSFSWQSRYYDHIIRDEKSLYRIREYIHYNPEKWEYDRENENDISIEVKRKMWKDILRTGIS